MFNEEWMIRDWTESIYFVLYNWLFILAKVLDKTAHIIFKLICLIF